MVEPEQSSPKSRSDAAREDPDPRLLELRRQIDAVDVDLLEKLNDRARLVQAVGELKQGNRFFKCIGDRKTEHSIWQL